MNYLDRNEFNFDPSQKVVEAIKNFDPKTLCFYTRIYDEGKKSVISVKVSEIYGVPEEQVLLTYGGEDMLKNAIHYFLSINSQNGAKSVAVLLRCTPCTSWKTPLPMTLTRSLNIPIVFIPVCCCWHLPTTPRATD